MRDFATSDHPQVQRQLDRLAALSLPQGRLGLETIHELLARVGNPQQHLPPTFHVAGTNGKGSTCAYLRAILEAEGLRVHAFTKPHLVRYNERIRVAGSFIHDDSLAHYLERLLDLGADLAPSFFEITAAAMLLAFAETPADACIIEVGLGGRFDATNVLANPAACGIASLGIDHEAFLLRPEQGTPVEPLARIAFEKASIAKEDCPLITQSYTPLARDAMLQTAHMHGATVFERDIAWKATAESDGSPFFLYEDHKGSLRVPNPSLPGQHQMDNAALAIAMIRHQTQLRISDAAIIAGIPATTWPARLQKLGYGPLTALAPNRTVWLDGGHNPDAGIAIARYFQGQEPLHLVLGMLSNKDPAALLAPLRNQLASVSIVPAPGHDAHAPETFAAHTDLPVHAYAHVGAALQNLAQEPNGQPILIAGSLYLAGEVLRLNAEIPQ